MLNFKAPVLEDMDWVKECFSYAHSMNCEYTFGNILLWSVPYRTQITHYNGFFICRWGKDKDISYSLPIGKGDFKNAVDEIIKDAEDMGNKARIYGVTESYKNLLEENFPGKFSFSYDDGNNDYIYNATDLAVLSGKKYHSKRNHITNFKKNNPDWCFEPINENNISECIDLHTNWIEERDDNDPDYSLEFEAVLRGFELYSQIGFEGGIIRVNSKPIAYTYGERLNDKCFVTHFEKAPADVQGAYPIICQEFTKNCLMDFEYVNREEDLGIEGLRRAKQSYYPEILLKKWVAKYND